jgi:hypothetical protein
MATVKFVSSLLELPAVKTNPVLWQHMNQEFRNVPASAERNVGCRFCFATSAPRIVVKRRRLRRRCAVATTAEKKKADHQGSIL